jgi:hypothetical protein
VRTTDVLLLILAPLALAAVPASIAMLSTPAPLTESCPPGHDLRTGVRRDGRFECWPWPVGDPEWDGTWGRSPDRSVQPPGIVDRKIHCTGGSRPIVVDYKTVGCQMGGAE